MSKEARTSRKRNHKGPAIPKNMKETSQAVCTLHQQEREESRKKQAEGIAKAKARGVRFGRPMLELPPNFNQIVAEWESKHISIDTAVRLCSVSSSTFFRRVREYRRNLEK